MAEYIEREPMIEEMQRLIDNVSRNFPKATETELIILKGKYEAFMEYIKEQPAADVQPIDRWISIEDSLPEPYSNVILYTNYKATAYGFFRGEYYEGKPLFSMTMSNNAENSWYEEVRITHWQPLPDPPKEG